MSTDPGLSASPKGTARRRRYSAPVLTLESRVGPDTSKNNTRNNDNHTGNSGISGPGS
jgi:hypothetical protein